MTCPAYFASQVRIRALLDQLCAWRGTRWQHAGTRPNEMKCGVSGDCLFWVHAFKAIGALPEKITIPDYRMMEARGDGMALLRTKMMATGRADLVWSHRDEPGPLRLPWLYIGDVLLFTNGMSGAHCGIVVRTLPEHFLHLSGNGMLEEPLSQAHYLRDLRFIYRLLEPSTANLEPATVNAS